MLDQRSQRDHPDPGQQAEGMADAPQCRIPVLRARRRWTRTQKRRRSREISGVCGVRCAVCGVVLERDRAAILLMRPLMTIWRLS